VEIIFPVSSEAVSATGSDDDLAVVPGVQGGEGCSTAGGCATCPFMKMNSLDALVDLLERMPEAGSLTSGGVPRDLLGFLPPRRSVVVPMLHVTTTTRLLHRPCSCLANSHSLSMLLTLR
jgi:quinolinate synthase